MSSSGIRWTVRHAAAAAGVFLLLVVVLIANRPPKCAGVAAGATLLRSIGERSSLQAHYGFPVSKRRARGLDNVAPQFDFWTGKVLLDEPRLFAIPPTDGEILRKLDMHQNRSSAEALTNEPPLIWNTLINHGGMGNQLFQYAGLLALAVKYNRYPVIPATNVPSIYQYFNVHMTIIKHAVDWSGPVLETCVGWFEQFDELDHRPGDNRVVKAYFQSWKYVEPIRSVLKSTEFRYKPHFADAAAGLMMDVRRKCKTSPRGTASCIVIGVHNRRGDVMEKRWQNMGFPIADVDYFNRTMSFYAQKYGNRSQIIFAIVSNDREWSLSNLQAKLGSLFHIHVFETSTNPAVDHCFLTLCDHLIITSGTFGWWAGYLGRGDVVYMKNYPIPGSLLAEVGFPILSDYYPKEWIAM